MNLSQIFLDEKSKDNISKGVSSLLQVKSNMQVETAPSIRTESKQVQKFDDNFFETVLFDFFVRSRRAGLRRESLDLGRAETFGTGFKNLSSRRSGTLG